MLSHKIKGSMQFLFGNLICFIIRLLNYIVFYFEYDFFVSYLCRNSYFMQLTLNVPDNKLPFFMELLQSLGFVKMETNGFSLSPRQKELTDAELRKADETPDYMLDFEAAWKNLKMEE